ncbi:helix-turn-helix transcriptional regulator [Eggerthella lenta]|uniref:Helix-turn-helix transcriptional regulator n=1 Tax=Eggerthella lenta TaxID=84112 RepID=A0A5C5BS49_EGGLN|nr:helix-turn-helix transcriptional regulator [Eggerthella lenta]TNU89007.1 helix-turn-helix transcriptional regulator [Eggerthella lenta]
MLKEKRKQAKLSQPKLSKESDVPLRTIQNWEKRGIEHATVGSLKRVCDVLGCKIDDLL